MDTKQVIADFIKVAEIAGSPITREQIIGEQMPGPPHKPPSSLPAGKMAVYVFELGDQCLKVGRAGPNSGARYTSHHYNPKAANSNLANSVLQDQHKEELGASCCEEDSVGQWIRDNTSRTNFLLDESVGIRTLNLLEAFLQCLLRPRYEGNSSQSVDPEG